MHRHKPSTKSQPLIPRTLGGRRGRSQAGDHPPSRWAVCIDWWPERPSATSCHTADAPAPRIPPQRAAGRGRGRWEGWVGAHAWLTRQAVSQLGMPLPRQYDSSDHGQPTCELAPAHRLRRDHGFGDDVSILVGRPDRVRHPCTPWWGGGQRVASSGVQVRTRRVAINRAWCATGRPANAATSLAACPLVCLHSLIIYESHSTHSGGWRRRPRQQSPAPSP